MRTTTLSGKRLSAKLAECPADAYPHGVSESEDGSLLIYGMPFDAAATYTVTDNVHDRDAESVNTIDSDWSVCRTDNAVVNIYKNRSEWCYAMFINNEFDHSDVLDDCESEHDANAAAARLFPGATIRRVAQTAF